MSRRVVIIASKESYEPETIGFLNAISISNDSTIYFLGTPQQITGENIWLLLDNCVVSIKNAVGLTLGVNNLSNKFKFIYPRIGDTSSQFRYNLVTATADGSYFGGWTFTPAGAKPNGTNGYFNSGYFNDSVVRDSVTWGVFIKDSFNNLYPEGAQGSGNADILFYPRYLGSSYSKIQNGANSILTNPSSNALWIYSRTARTEYNIYKSSSLFGTITATSEAYSPQGKVPMYEGAAASTNAGTPIQFGTSLRTFSIFGSGLTPTQVVNFTNSITTFDTALNR